MSIRRDLVIKVSNGSATLDMPLQIYEKDHGIELRFKLMDYKYKYDKDPENILNSNKEDILEAYTTIVNPRGYELAQINGEVVEDTVKFMIEDSYTDELEELGTYQLQIHVKCKHSEFSIPPVRFEVLERLKGEKVVTDGDDEVDYSDIIDGSTKFIDDETGKLIIQWQKGDTISSVRLNAMVEVINNAVDEEAQRQLNEVEREQQELEREQQELERENRLQAALNSVDARVDESMNEYETRFNALTASQQQDMEVIDARDGEVSLKARLDRDIRNPLQVYEDVEGSYISCDSNEGHAQNVEILGNTIQDEDNLADIRSVGDEVEGQELYEIPVLSVGKNLCREVEHFGINISDGQANTGVGNRTNYMRVEQGLEYTFSKNNVIRTCVKYYYDKNKEFISADNVVTNATFTIPQNVYYLRLSWGADVEEGNYQLEEGTVATPYEPYQEDKLTILSPVQLEKVGDVADRIICKDGVWGVEKNIDQYILTRENYKPTTFRENDTAVCVGYNFTPTCVGTNNLQNAISTRLVCKNINQVYNSFEVGFAINNYKWLYVTILKSNIVNISLEDISDWIFEQPFIVHYELENQQFIPLPHDQQIKLRTFEGQTNIYFETEIEGTLKASIPQSIGSAINTHTEQIGNLNKELDRVKKLEESTVSTVVTESEFTTVEQTTNGYFEDVKLEGKTLVNLAGSVNDYFNQFAVVSRTCMLLKCNTEYTAVINNKADHTVRIYGNEGSLLSTPTFDIPAKTTIIKKLCTKDVVDDTGLFKSNSTTDTLFQLDINLLEGDHTQNPPSYFEGLKSVGQDVEDVSIKSVKNLLDYTKIVNKVTDGTTGVITINNNRLSLDVKDRIEVYSPQIYVKCRDTLVAIIGFAEKDGVPIYDSGYLPLNTTSNLSLPSEVKYITINAKIGNATPISKEALKNVFIYHQSDKKPLLYYNPETQTWEKPILREWDSIEKHADGKYYYHKRSGEVVLNGSESWIIDNTATKETSLHFRLNDASYNLKPANNNSISVELICDKFTSESADFVWCTDTQNPNGVYEGIGINEGCFICVRVLKSKLSPQDTAGFKAWLQANPTTVVYQLTQEEVYECINIDLMTYENETNYVVDAGAITPKSTLKVICNITNVARELQQKVSNLETSIDGLVTVEQLDRVKKLEESTVSTVTTESDFTTVEETTNGYFEDVKLEGKTLVNLWGNESSDFIFSGQTSFNPTTQCVEYTSTTNRFSNCFTKNVSQYKPNTKYTIVVNVLENTFKSVLSNILKINSNAGSTNDIGVSTETKNILGGFIGVQVFTITTSSDLSSPNIGVRTYIDNINSEEGVTLKFNMIILEGDYTQNPPSYFEGLMSVGQDVEEVSVESVTGNLFDGEFVDGMIQSSNGILSASSLDWYSSKNYMTVIPNIQYIANGSIIDGVFEYDKDFNYLGYAFINNSAVEKAFITKPNTKYIKLRAGKTEFIQNTIQINVGTRSAIYIQHQSDKKPLLYYNNETQTWEKPILREWDSIEKHADGKYYYHKRSEEIVLNGSDSFGYWLASTQPADDTLINIYVSKVLTYGKTNGILICDKFVCVDSYVCGTCYAGGSGNMHFILPKTTFGDANTFKVWLQANPVTVVYQLAEEEVYECINIDLITYENETNFIVNTGVIVPKTTLKVTCNIANVVRELQQKVSNLENYIQHVMIDALNNALNE